MISEEHTFNSDVRNLSLTVNGHANKLDVDTDKAIVSIAKPNHHTAPIRTYLSLLKISSSRF